MKNYLKLIKFSHTIFALPFALVGYFLAIHKGNHGFDIVLFFQVILCMVFARSAAMAFNRYIDRDIDKANPRTKVREIPAGIIKAKSALYFVIINCLGLIVTTFFINKLVFFLSPVALLITLGYSYTKRFTWLCHIVLGLGLALAPIGAYMAVTASISIIPILIGVMILLWVGGFDIIYALQDADFDKNMKLKSIPSYFGPKRALLISRGLHVLSALCLSFAALLIFYEYLNLGYLSIMGAVIFIILLIYQHSLVKHNDFSKIGMAFFTLNGIASVVYASLLIMDFYLV